MAVKSIILRLEKQEPFQAHEGKCSGYNLFNSSRHGDSTQPLDVPTVVSYQNDGTGEEMTLLQKKP